MRRLPRALAITGTVLALGGTAFAAQQIAGRDRAPADAVVTISSSSPLFAADGLVGGEQLERCTVLRNEGPQPADVTLFGTSAVSDLSPWLELDLVRGALPSGTPAGDCTGFMPDAADYGSGTPGVVFRGTLATLPDADSGIADPSRWAVGEEHAYLLRVTYTGANPQQGLQTVQDFNWGVTPFDDRPPEPLTNAGTTPQATTASSPIASGANAGANGERQCTVVSFGAGRPYIGARATIKAKQVKSAKKSKKTATKTAKRKASLAALGVAPSDVLGGSEDLATLPEGEAEHRADVLKATRATAARRTPVMVVRITPSKRDTLNLRVALRKNNKMTSPRRWKWVRMRLNATSTKSTVRWPFVSVAKMTQLRTGYNQIDLTLNRGARDQRIKGLPRLVRRSFAFVVKGTKGSTDCVLG
ncbi:MAG: hypothetical protein J7513_06375 [Solirubrobacteraceae bacterium]|nr:hypothetical protein [Solirubrobacteraceae bacterium]